MEFDEENGKQYALSICMNNPSMGFDFASILNGMRRQFEQCKAHIESLEKECAALYDAVKEEGMCAEYGDWNESLALANKLRKERQADGNE